MPDLLWSPDMSVGCDALDADHRALLALVRQLDLALRKQEPFEVVSGLLTAYLELTRGHAEREERLHRLLGLAVDEDHEAAHAAFTAWADGVRADYLDSRDAGRVRAVLPIIVDWWYRHVLDLDMADRPLYQQHAGRIARLLNDPAASFAPAWSGGEVAAVAAVAARSDR
ncbi:hemerythrin domain-containing protein [Caenispirillum bisanense]|uniref:bacteriohemerythrin n=1 Tax=Caenispirillum bisanense TaxID=414052 RepID=UPI0031CDC28A